ADPAAADAGSSAGGVRKRRRAVAALDAARAGGVGVAGRSGSAAQRADGTLRRRDWGGGSAGGALGRGQSGAGDSGGHDGGAFSRTFRRAAVGAASGQLRRIRAAAADDNSLKNLEERNVGPCHFHFG